MSLELFKQNRGKKREKGVRGAPLTVDKVLPETHSCHVPDHRVVYLFTKEMSIDNVQLIAWAFNECGRGGGEGGNT